MEKDSRLEGFVQRYNVLLEFTEPLLGTVPKDKEIYSSFIQGKAPVPDEANDELESVPSATDEEKGWTGFHHKDGEPFLFDYQLKGYLKDACGCLRRQSKTRSATLKAYLKEIDSRCFIAPRRVMLSLSGEMGVLERPLRAKTAQGDRVALVKSDIAPAGTEIEFTIQSLGLAETLIREWLAYGAFRGLGQWRNASYGRFLYELEKEGEKEA